MTQQTPATVAADGSSIGTVSPPPSGNRARVSESRFSGAGWYVLGRVMQGAFVMLGAVVISFVLVNISGSPANVALGSLATPEQREAFNHELGFDDPFLTRLGDYLTNAAHGDFGQSYRSGESAAGMVFDALPNTVLLVVCALTLAALTAIPLAIFSVLNRESVGDRVFRRVLVLVGSLPDYWVALVLVLIFAIGLGIFPVSGFDGPSSLILPVTAIALPVLPGLVRILRGALLDTAGKDFVFGLRAKGFSDRHIMWHHGLKNSSVPFVTWLSLQLGQLLGGTLIIEIVFSWPGIGFLLNDAVASRDLAIIQAIVIVVAAFYVLFNLCADLLVLLIDPRVRIRGRS